MQGKPPKMSSEQRPEEVSQLPGGRGSAKALGENEHGVFRVQHEDQWAGTR